MLASMHSFSYALFLIPHIIKAASPTLPYPNAHIVANLRGAEYGGDVRCPLQDEHDGAASEYTI